MLFHRSTVRIQEVRVPLMALLPLAARSWAAASPVVMPVMALITDGPQ